jgi:hypothetical protein
MGHQCKDVRIYVLVLDPHTSKAKVRLTIQINNPCRFYMQTNWPAIYISSPGFIAVAIAATISC